MKKFMVYTMVGLFVSTLTLGGVGWSVSEANAAKKPAAAEQAIPAGEQFILTGTIDANSQLVNEQGEIFSLANNDKGMEVKSMNGMKVEIKGTVMEKEGQKVVEVIDYNVLK